jgi:hypothetical protein
VAVAIVPLFLREELGLELVDGVPGLFDETAQIPGHTSALTGSEQDQKEETYDHHLFRTDSEHLSLKLLLGSGIFFLRLVRATT